MLAPKRRVLKPPPDPRPTKKGRQLAPSQSCCLGPERSCAAGHAVSTEIQGFSVCGWGAQVPNSSRILGFTTPPQKCLTWMGFWMKQRRNTILLAWWLPKDDTGYSDTLLGSISGSVRMEMWQEDSPKQVLPLDRVKKLSYM